MSTTEQDDEMSDCEKENQQSFSWSKFKRLFLCNKRIWKYLVLYSIIYFSVRKTCAPWYSPSNAKKLINDSIGNDELMIEGIIGLDSHKPATMCTMFSEAVAHLILLRDPKYRKATFTEIIASIDRTYKNNDVDNHILDIHVSVWAFLVLMDALYSYQKGRFSFGDATMMVHHVSALLTASIFKYKQRGGFYWCWVGLFSEGMASLMLLGSLLRVFYQKKRPDLQWIKHFSDINFALHGIGFLYIRVFAFPRITVEFLPKWLKDDSNHVLTKAYMILITCLMVPVGYYWSFHMVRVIAEKMMEVMSKKQVQ